MAGTQVEPSPFLRQSSVVVKYTSIPDKACKKRFNPRITDALMPILFFPKMPQIQNAIGGCPSELLVSSKQAAFFAYKMSRASIHKFELDPIRAKGNLKPRERINKIPIHSKGWPLFVASVGISKFRALNVDWFLGREWLLEYDPICKSNTANVLILDQSPNEAHCHIFSNLNTIHTHLEVDCVV